MSQSTLDDYGSDAAEANVVLSQSGIGQSNTLEFTGNWFIDAGILGFVNLMEEVYGDAWIEEWKKEHPNDNEDVDFLFVLQERIKREPEKIYYGYFPMAYVFYNNKVRGKEKIAQPDTTILKHSSSKNDHFEKSWKWIVENYGEVKVSKGKTVHRIDLSPSGQFYYFQNFLFFQPSWGSDKQKNAFMEVLSLKKIEQETLQKIDKTIDKFLPSREEFSNIPYGSSFLDYKNINYIFILCFPFSFIKETGRRLFYSYNILFTYKVNKKLKVYSESLGNDTNIFNTTWRAVLDTIAELESLWNLEEMYIIKYNLGKNQAILNVEFIGLSKVHANIIVDDNLRDYLNILIPIRILKTGQYDWKWILEELIKNNSLYPLILGHTNLAINGKHTPSRYTAIYSLSIEYTIIQHKNDIFIFSDFFEQQAELKELPSMIKKNASRMFGAASYSSKLFISDISTNKNFAVDFFLPIKKRNRNAFVNVLLKNLAGKEEKHVSKLLSYVFENIIQNENWEYWALPIVMGLIGGNRDG